jgi:hypothetical protein
MRRDLEKNFSSFNLRCDFPSQDPSLTHCHLCTEIKRLILIKKKKLGSNGLAHLGM